MKFLDKSLYLSNRIYDTKWITAIRKGLLYVFPLIMIGSFATLIKNLPIKFYQSVIQSLFSDNWVKTLNLVIDLSLGVIGLILAFTISYANASITKDKMKVKINPALVAAISVCAFLISIPSDNAETLIGNLGPSGLFDAIITALVSSELMLRLSESLKISKVKFSEEPALKQAIIAIAPSILVIASFIIGKQIMLLIFGMDIHSFFIQFLQIIAKTTNLVFGFLYTFFTQFFWFFGVHGSNLLSKALDYRFGGPPNGSHFNLPMLDGIFNKTLFDVFVLIGGAGGTICLILAIFIAAKKSNTLKIAKISLFPAIFNINEIIIFGLPIVLNPFLLIPFIFGPVIMLSVTYAAILLGIVPPVTNIVDWTTPPLLSGYLATGSIKGVFLQLFNIALGTLIYIPFVKANERYHEKAVRDIYHQMLDLIKKREFAPKLELLSRNDRIGNLARDLANEIKQAIECDELMLEYQPQVNCRGEVIGVEALLRWPHKRFGRIPPNLSVAIAEESGMVNELGRWVIRKAIRQLGEWKQQGIENIRMSINVSPTEMQDALLPPILREAIEENGIKPHLIELEITEGVAIELNEQTMDVINELISLGVCLAMDDFGMGYTSLLYIRYFKIHTIKIDGSLTKNLLVDKACQDIISSMVYLCNSLGIKIIAEYVETENQKEILKSLGCNEYQGYLFSPPLPPEKCSQFIKDS